MKRPNHTLGLELNMSIFFVKYGKWFDGKWSLETFCLLLVLRFCIYFV